MPGGENPLPKEEGNPMLPGHPLPNSCGIGPTLAPSPGIQGERLGACHDLRGRLGPFPLLQPFHRGP